MGGEGVGWESAQRAASEGRGPGAACLREQLELRGQHLPPSPPSPVRQCDSRDSFLSMNLQRERNRRRPRQCGVGAAIAESLTGPGLGPVTLPCRWDHLRPRCSPSAPPRPASHFFSSGGCALLMASPQRRCRSRRALTSSRRPLSQWKPRPSSRHPSRLAGSQ